MVAVLPLLCSGAGVGSTEDRSRSVPRHHQDMSLPVPHGRVTEKTITQMHMLSHLKTRGAVFRSAQSHTCPWSHHFRSSGAPSDSLMEEVPASEKFTNSANS